MTERLADIDARLRSVQQLATVVSAMRNIAATRAREARERLEGLRAYADTLGGAIGIALGLEAGEEVRPEARDGLEVLIVLTAEQGFAGAFSDHVLEAAAHWPAPSGATRRLFLLGSRGASLAAERGLEVDFFAPMASHVDQAAGLAERLSEALFRATETGTLQRVSILHAAPVDAGPAEIRTLRLVPFDRARFAPLAPAAPPLTGLAPELLLAKLADEYVFAQLCEAIVLSFAAENEARLRAMTAAHRRVGDLTEELTGRSRRVRQEEITSEILELVAGRASGRRR